MPTLAATLGGPLAPGSVAAYYASLERRPALCADPFLPTLDHHERGRALAFRREADRLAFAAAHALARTALSHAAGEARTWRLRADDLGKPELDPPCGNPPLRFSLSHTRGMVACAIARLPIGIDVESVGRGTPFAAVAQRYFATEECQELDRAPSTARRQIFFRFWTLKEALAKAVGRGLSLPFRDYPFRLDPPRLRASAAAPGEDWHFESFAPSARHVLGLAVHDPARTPLAVQWWRVDLEALSRAELALTAATHARAGAFA